MKFTKSRRPCGNGSCAARLAASAALLLCVQPVRAIDTLAYSFEDQAIPADSLQGFHANGGGITVAQDTIGATQGSKSMKISVVGGATFVGALSEGPLFPSTVIGDPPGIDHVHFDLTITQRFDIPNPTPPPDRIGFARLGVYIFGGTQPDEGGTQIFDKAILADITNDEVSIGNLEPGTYRDMRIDLDKLTDPLDFSTKTFNELFGVLGSGSDLIPTGFQLYVNKSGGASFPLTIYVDNIRFGMSVPGDYDGNDSVDAADYVLWRKSTNPIPPNFRNEVASLGTIDAADYTAWRARFGNNTSPGSGSGGGLGSGTVPEPASVCLLLMGLTAIGGVRRRLTAVG